MMETCRSHHDFLSDLPVYCLTDSELCISSVDGGGNGGPSFGAGSAVHAEVAIEASDTFIAEERLLFAVVATVHDEGEFAGVRMGLSTGDESSSVHGDEASLDCQVDSVLEDQSTALNSNTLQNRSILVDKESSSFGHVDQIIVDGRHIDTPSRTVAPFNDVEETIANNSITASQCDSESVVLIIGAAPGANCALDLSGGRDAHNWTVDSIDGDDRRGDVESSTSNGESIPATDVAIARANTINNRCLVLPVLDSSSEGLSVAAVMIDDI
jgi:hypothetical protein